MLEVRILLEVLVLAGRLLVTVVLALLVALLQEVHRSLRALALA